MKSDERTSVILIDLLNDLCFELAKSKATRTCQRGNDGAFSVTEVRIAQTDRSASKVSSMEFPKKSEVFC